MTSTSLPNYEEFNQALIKAKSPFNPAQIHGLFCGFMSASLDDKEFDWNHKLLGGKKSRQLQTLFKQLYETSFHQISEFSFEFMMLLPDDETDINARTETLGLWCQGFLTGLSEANIDVENQTEGSELAEAFNDLIEIAQVSYGDIEDNDEAETAYFELVEYVRLAVLMIFQELKKENLEAAEQNKLLH